MIFVSSVIDNSKPLFEQKKILKFIDPPLFIDIFYPKEFSYPIRFLALVIWRHVLNWGPPQRGPFCLIYIVTLFLGQKI